LTLGQLYNNLSPIPKTRRVKIWNNLNLEVDLNQRQLRRKVSLKIAVKDQIGPKTIHSGEKMTRKDIVIDLNQEVKKLKTLIEYSRNL
jgi:hypothetical protein